MGKPTAAICHGPWLLVEAGSTPFPSERPSGSPGRAAASGRFAASVGSQQVEERPDPVTVLRGVPEQAVRVHGIPSAAPHPGPDQVARFLQVSHDRLDGALGEADDRADVADPGFWVAGDLHQHVTVPGEQCPAAVALVLLAHLPDYIIMR